MVVHETTVTSNGFSGIEKGFDHDGLGVKLDPCDSSKSRKISGVATLVQWLQSDRNPPDS